MNVTLKGVERIGNRWHPYVERHENCGVDSHAKCRIMQRSVGPGFAELDEIAATERVEVVLSNGEVVNDWSRP